MQKRLNTILLMALLMPLTGSTKPLDDREVIAITILAEARGEGKTGMYAVACVISQRMIDRKLTGSQVCLQKWQFSCWNPNDPQKGKLNSLLNHSMADYALQLADNLQRIDRSFVGYANHYHTKRVKPYWSKGKTPVKIIGNHLFFKL